MPGEGRVVGVCRTGSVVAGGCGSPRRSHEVPRAPPPQVQLHLVEMIKAKKSGAGHKMYKVCRRVLTGSIVAEDTYCLEFVGKELRGEGERNAQGEEEGRGTEVYASGNMYEGQWLAGKKHGQGKYTFATGNVYEGEFVEGQRHGHAKYTFAIGDVYEGEFQGAHHGRGKETNADGSSYDGEWADGKKHGRGKFTFADGDVYDGEFADHEQHGIGTYTYANGNVEVGCYEAGADVGQGVKWSADRAEAWEMQAGEQGRSIPLDEAAKIAERIGLPVPP